ncbi:uncharacterized protein G2W53_029596 [Senna tora]|uniref:Uncharacterized protein n=1 Tax=Senna tora TaxID=362788 RepID=A0A834T7X1_9FABA|nr:uncharacterized protein G2W53_029596 [Senna tora]
MDSASSRIRSSYLQLASNVLAQ